MTRQTQLTAAANALAEAMLCDPSGETGADPAAYAAIINRDGWTLHTPAGHTGNLVRHEGVVFTASELARIVRHARQHTHL